MEGCILRGYRGVVLLLFVVLTPAPVAGRDGCILGEDGGGEQGKMCFFVFFWGGVQKKLANCIIL